MFITIFDRIEQWILDYFDCPPDPNPERLKWFWKYMVSLCTFCAIIAVSIFIFIFKGDNSKMFFIGVALILLSLILSKINNKNKTLQNHTIAWWHGEGKWYNLFIKGKK